MAPTKASFAPGPFARHRGLVIFTASALAVGLGIRYQANKLRQNDLQQKNAGGLYVSVDRSGGGI
ncbi:uncharacterized protein E0L32_008573 [Thyridium curvatum]|uniref:Prohibitin n=1 Tax=Thyridium curvatum TaxID=1093900 RepID=A0A507ART7_9PEZI|nr:uncharacterized protein E0L32_008573 [Thyridium curvatum]TPX10523.1 hypothetical protein E0L32_008573 [Thyridium curvatum]